MRIKKKEKLLQKRVNFAKNTNYDIFPQKQNMKAHFRIFFTCLVHVLQYLKNSDVVGNIVFALVNYSGYEQPLKKWLKLANTQILIFSLKNNI